MTKKKGPWVASIIVILAVSSAVLFKIINAWTFVFVLDATSGLYKHQLSHLKQLCESRMNFKIENDYYAWFVALNKMEEINLKNCSAQTINRLLRIDPPQGKKQYLDKVFEQVKDKIGKPRNLAVFISGHGGPRVYGDVTVITASDISKSFNKYFKIPTNYLLLDACLTGDIESLNALKTSARTVTVNHQTLPAAGIDYKKVMDRLGRHQVLDENSIAGGVLDAYRESYERAFGIISVGSYSRLDNLESFMKGLKNSVAPRLKRDDYVMGWHEFSESLADLSSYVHGSGNKELIESYGNLLSSIQLNSFSKSTKITGPTIFYPLKEKENARAESP